MKALFSHLQLSLFEGSLARKLRFHGRIGFTVELPHQVTFCQLEVVGF